MNNLKKNLSYIPDNDDTSKANKYLKYYRNKKWGKLTISLIISVVIYLVYLRMSNGIEDLLYESTIPDNMVPIATFAFVSLFVYSEDLDKLFRKLKNKK